MAENVEKLNDCPDGFLDPATKKFAKGHPPHPRGGRPKQPERPKSAAYLGVIAEQVTTEKWRAIVNTALEQAIAGDGEARSWLTKMVNPGQFVAETKIETGSGLLTLPDNELAVRLMAWANRAIAAQAVDLAHQVIDIESNGELNDGNDD